MVKAIADVTCRESPEGLHGAHRHRNVTLSSRELELIHDIINICPSIEDVMECVLLFFTLHFLLR